MKQQTSFEHNPRVASDPKQLRSVKRPPWADVDLNMARRPGVPMMHDPKPFPNTRYPPERQPGEPTVPKHARPGKPLPPVFGTATPIHGLSGLVKRLAYSLPDHKPTHWMLVLLSDRVEWWTYRFKKYAPFVLPVVAVGLLTRRNYLASR